MVSSLSRFHEWKLEQLLQDFIPSHFERIGRGDGLTRNSSADIKGVLSNTHVEKGKFPKKKQHGKGDVNKNRRKIVCCWKCKGEVSEDEASSINYSAKLLPQHFENLVEFYDKEIAHRSANSANQETSEIVSPNGSINIAQQILSTSSMSSTTGRWLFDTGADIDATNKRTNLVPDTIVDLEPKQFPVQTGSEVVYAECVGEVLLSLKGVKSERMVIRLKYIVCLKPLPINIMSGERFFRRGGYLDRNRIINPEGRILTHIDTERRGFFLWLHGRPEPLKSVSSKTLATHTSSTLEIDKESKSTANKVADQEFRVAYNACHTNGIFKISDDVMSHPSVDRLKWTIKNTIGIDLNPADIKSLPCEACDMGKSVKFTTNVRRPRINYVGEEDVSRYRIFRALKQKSEAAAELRTILSTASIELRQSHRQRVKQVTIDGGRDWGLTSFQEFAAEQNIEVIVSAPDNQYQNGVSERSIRFVQDAARCCSIQMKVPSVFWNHMLDMACHTLNCSSQSPINDRKTPWEVYWSVFNPSKRVPCVDYLWIPGSLCIAHVEASHRVTGEKLDARGTRCVFLGYRGTKNKLVWLLDGGRFLITPQVVAHESVGSKSRKTNYARNEDFNIARESLPTTLVPRGRGRPKRTIQRPYKDQVMLHLNVPTCVDENLAAILNSMTSNLDENRDNHVTTKRSSVDSELLSDEYSINILSRIQNVIHNQTYSQNSDGDDLFRLLTTFSEARTCLVASARDEPTYRQAITCAEKKEWIDAMFKEIDGCLSRNTFRFVDRNKLTRKGRLVSSKWVLKKKYKPNMVLDKYKARVVTRGFTKTKGVDFNETSSITARSASWRILMALAALNEWYILQADFIEAYLAGELKEHVSV
ncbi:hypothetical protein EPUL_005493 [Erysiphe pulchra]|uniref:Integrase catalytic domain-containing protein n=1 Tax=Erysiphe pulchra TaxID=225359 RepID=A0A2S4PN68_9PEZI|nr:hypothetical protein EPUL_005493 [Erysiphe pulchra]